MMRKLFAILAITLIAVASVSAQTSKKVHVETAGTLSTLLTDDEKQTVEKIELSGDVNSRDIALLKVMLRKNKLKDIDLSACTALKTLDKFAFIECRSLKSIALPASLKELGEYALSTTGLTSLDLSHCDSLTVISGSAFYASGSLRNVSLPSGVTSIGETAFGYTHVEEVDLSHCHSLATIGRGAFSNCNSLTKVILPSSVLDIHKNAFDLSLSEDEGTATLGIVSSTEDLADNIEPTGSFTIMASVPPSAAEAFSKLARLQYTLYVPKGSCEAYKAADGWSSFKNVVEVDF